MGDFAKRLEKALENDLDRVFWLIFEVKVPRGYSQSSLSVALVAKGAVATGFINREDLSFWRDQFWVLDKMYLNIEEANEGSEKIVERFRKMIALTKPFLDELSKIED